MNTLENNGNVQEKMKMMKHAETAEKTEKTETAVKESAAADTAVAGNVGAAEKSCTGCETSGGCDKTDCKNCAHKKKVLKIPANPGTHIKHVIGIVSGKGGVGKSSVTSMTAVELSRQGYRVGILDADVTGPSIPQIFGLHDVVKMGKEKGIEPAITSSGIKVMSVNVLLEEADTPVVWRGPVITGVVKQFWKDVLWRDLDYLLIDMPPGTGDVPLTVFQSLPVDGILMVTSPQTLVGMIVKKACKMADKLQVPILGLIENYSYVVCPDCSKKIPVFGKSRVETFAEECNLSVLAKLPVDEKLVEAEDEGTIETYSNQEIQQMVQHLVEILPVKE